MKTQLLKSYRVRVGITQKVLAKLLQIDVTTYSKKENGVIEFKASEILILKKTLNLTPIEIDEIFFNSSVEFNSTNIEAI
ncbi:MAG: helix-turn-helix transcriptional regulator [Clostridium celatum]|uniref:helix-turn-helix transcriptional regulator n=1 Tax=Clostridium celatum TaxID=36834 RepID=UPI001F3EF37F|nr:helix-turn-helix transcriptional regulator [Clostridium celatum]MCE9655659.1 helix-turn-helix domain-containing protein [Clostridium celatum]MDU3722654.1 helix-turn-helix transcriptional regulator [Clostridium celatum]